MISEPAPTFAIPAVSASAAEPFVAASNEYAGQWLLLLFYPRDFSFVCPTELTSFSARLGEFEERHCRILGVSVDSIDSHQEWLTTPPADGGLGPLRFPLASDPDGAVAKEFGVWLEDKGVSTRGLFLIDPHGILQYGVAHNLSVGRNVDEILRVLEALQSGGLCPAGWTTADGNLDPEQALQPGRVLGHYRIQRLLGVGTFGSVFAAWDLRLERNVALKILKRNSAESREAALREARAAAALSHPNVCGIYAVEEEDGLPVMAMEYIDGRPLNALAGEGLPLANRVRLAHGIAAGLAAAHALEIVHGDLKPLNILVTADLVPRILDFGLSRQAGLRRVAEPAADSSPESVAEFLAATGKLLSGGQVATGAGLDATVLATELASPGEPHSFGLSGTPAYMAPEQWLGEPAAPATDIFAWGLIFYELMAGRRAVSGNTLGELSEKIRDPRLPALLAAGVPDAFRELLLATLSSDPAARPTAAAVRARLEN